MAEPESTIKQKTFLALVDGDWIDLGIVEAWYNRPNPPKRDGPILSETPCEICDQCDYQVPIDSAPTLQSIRSNYEKELLALTKKTWHKIAAELTDAEWIQFWKYNYNVHDVAHACQEYEERERKGAHNAPGGFSEL